MFVKPQKRLSLLKKRNLLAETMSDISIEKRMEINADIRIGCVDVAKIVESMARKCESVEVIT